MAQASEQGQARSTLCASSLAGCILPRNCCIPFERSLHVFALRKASLGNGGGSLVYVESKSMKASYAVIPTNIPFPVALGTLVREPEKHFYLADFCDMEDELQSIFKFTEVMAAFHQKPVSSTGKFDFHITTYGVNQPVDTTWCMSWEEIYRCLFPKFSQ